MKTPNIPEGYSVVALKACPFCGGAAVYSRVPGQGFSIICRGCGALALHRGTTSKDVLGAQWNRREVRHNFNIASKIKACPFCSSRTGIKKMQNNSSILVCERCGMMVSFAGADDLNGTINLWNRRT